MKDSVNGPTRQHHSMAVNLKLTPEPGGPPTTDVFEGPVSAASGNVYGPDGGSRPASAFLPGEKTMAGSNY